MGDIDMRKFLREVFSENGVGSSKRILGTLMLIVCLVCVVYLVFSEGGTSVVENILITTTAVGAGLLGLSSVTSIFKNKENKNEQ